MTFTKSSSRRPRRILAGLLALTWLCMPSALWAVNCTAIDQYGGTRNCTWLEEHGQCLVEALDSRDQCLEDSSNIFSWYRCHEDAAIDMTVCNLKIPVRIIFR